MKKRIISSIAAILALACLAGCSENGGLQAADSGQNSPVNSSDNGDPTNSTDSAASTGGSAPSSSSTESGGESSTEKVESSSEKAESSSEKTESSTEKTESSTESKAESSASEPVEVSSSAGGGEIAPVELSADNMLNSIRLFDVINEDNENGMFSPLSLNMALGLIAEGARGGTKTALSEYLGTDDYSAFAEGYMNIVESQYNYASDYIEDWRNVFELANSFWANKNLPFREDYKSVLTEKFKAEVRNLDFADKEKALGEINGWVNEKTHKMIPSVLEDYSDDIAAVLINTIYFESAWREKWYINEDSKDKFTLPDGSVKELPLMHNGGDSYFENDKATAFSCGYLNGLDFIGILPKQTGDFTIEELDIPSLLESESYEYDVNAAMPTLEFESTFPLKDALKAFGLSEIFDSEKADFSGMSEASLFVSDVMQKTKLELDENGTKAAAVTALTMDAMSAMPVEREKREVTLDRPFAFMIYDSAENQIVFLGKVTNP